MITSVNFSASPNLGENLEPFVELKFPVKGKSLPADHGYGLYAAFVHLIPEIRQEKKLSILTIPGLADQNGKIFLTHQSCFKIRIPVSQVPLVYKLAGNQVSVGRHPIKIGIPQISFLEPAQRLKARIVTIKNSWEPDKFLASVTEQLNNLGISGLASVSLDKQGNICRKTIKIKQYQIIGFTTEISGLSDQDSLKLQQWGIGGKRHMGCGFFGTF